MANQRLYQFTYSKIPMLTLIDCSITFGATGAVSSFTGPLVKSVTRLATGVYQLEFTDNFNRFVAFEHDQQAPTTGSAIAAGSFVVGDLYQIDTLGTTDWASVGLPANVTPAVGQPFVATAVGSGTGTVLLMGTSGLMNVEVVGASSTLQSTNAFNGTGGYLMIQTLSDTDVLANPTSGSVIHMLIAVSNSSLSQ